MSQFPGSDCSQLLREMNALARDPACTAEVLLSWVEKNSKAPWTTWPNAVLHMHRLIYQKSHDLQLVFKSVMAAGAHGCWSADSSYISPWYFGKDTKTRAKSFFGPLFSDASLQEQLVFLEWVLDFRFPKKTPYKEKVLLGLLPRTSFESGSVPDRVRALILAGRRERYWSMRDDVRLLLEIAKSL